MLMNASTASSRLVLVAFLAIASLLVLFSSGSAREKVKNLSGTPGHNAGYGKSSLSEDQDLLNQLRLTPSFEYQRHCFAARQTRGLSRSALVNISRPLLTSTPGTVNLEDALSSGSRGQSLLPACSRPLTIEVPRFAPSHESDTSPLLLGMATKLSRVGPSLPALARWLSNTGSELVVLLVDQPDLQAVHDEVEATRREAERVGITILFRPYCCPDDTEGLKNFALAKWLWEAWTPEIRWFGLIDDDTFFVSLPRTYDALAKFDPSEQWYIGALTEGHTRLSEEGFKAWGGAGFFISPPLMQKLAEHSEECQILDTGFGDILWRDCIQKVTSPTVQLTEMRGLNQIDMWSDISGWYEAAHVPLYTVHHWKSWHYHPIPLASLVVDVAGPDSFLQRYAFSDSIVLSNGFSIAAYPNGLPDLGLVELTMVEDVNVYRPPGKLEFAHSLGMTRPALQLGKDKIQWKFETSVKGKDGSVRQLYIKRAPRADGLSKGPDSVVEIDWKEG